MRNDPCPRSELSEDGRAQANINIRQKVHGDHRGVTKIGFENVLASELDHFLDSGLNGIFLAFSNSLRVNIYAHGPDAGSFGRFDDYSPIAAAQIVEDISLFKFSQSQHFVHYLIRSGDKGDVKIDFLGLNRNRLKPA